MWTYLLTSDKEPIRDQSNDGIKVQIGEPVRFGGGGFACMIWSGWKYRCTTNKPSPTQMMAHQSCNPAALWRTCRELNKSPKSLLCSSVVWGLPSKSLFTLSINVGRNHGESSKFPLSQTCDILFTSWIVWASPASWREWFNSGKLLHNNECFSSFLSCRIKIVI